MRSLWTIAVEAGAGVGTWTIHGIAAGAENTLAAGTLGCERAPICGSGEALGLRLLRFGGLELKPGEETKRPAVVERVGDGAEVRRGNFTPGFGELGGVEEVDRLGAEGEFLVGLEGEGARDRCVYVGYACLSECVDADVASAFVGADEAEGGSG